MKDNLIFVQSTNYLKHKLIRFDSYQTEKYSLKYIVPRI